MSTYPGAVDTFRAIENLPGLTYNPDDKKTLFAEDLLALQSAVIAIEENPPTPAPVELPVGSIVTISSGDGTTSPFDYGTWACIASGDFFGGIITYSWERTV